MKRMLWHDTITTPPRLQSGRAFFCELWVNRVIKQCAWKGGRMIRKLDWLHSCEETASSQPALGGRRLKSGCGGPEWRRSDSEDKARRGTWNEISSASSMSSEGAEAGSFRAELSPERVASRAERLSSIRRPEDQTATCGCGFRWLRTHPLEDQGR